MLQECIELIEENKLHIFGGAELEVISYINLATDSI